MAVIERDPEAQDNLVDWWDYDEGLTPDTEVIVAADEVVLFWADGALLQLGPGRHALTASEHPALADYLAFDEAEALEVAFVRTSNYPLMFDGPIGDAQDKETQLALTFVAVCDTMDLQVKNAEALIRAMDQFDDEDAFDTFVAEQALEQARDVVFANLPPAKALSAEGSSVEADTRTIETKTNQVLEQLGFGVSLRFTDPVKVQLAEEDAETVRLYLRR